MPSLASALDSPVDGISPDESEEKHLWSSLLKEVTHKASVKLSSSKSLVVLGDDECGKTTLIARLQGTEDPKKGYGLEYTYLDVKDEDRDDQTKLNIWILDGNTVHSHLLKFALNQESFADTLVVIAVTMSEPWNIPEALDKWANILEEHIGRSNIPNEILEEQKQKMIQQFRDYLEPDSLLSVPHVAPTTPVSNVFTPARPSETTANFQQKKVSIHPATAALLSASLAPASTTAANATAANPVPDTPPDSDSEAQTSSPVEVPLDSNILCKNLGIPIIVVVTKSDVMNNLEKEERLTEEHFDFIQMHVRRFCLSYGAALFYVSVKEDKNCDLLNRYLQSRIYGFPFTQTAYVVERDCIFVPSGWDNDKKIGILEENLTQIRPQSAYNEVIPKPPPRKTAVKEPEFLAHDEQSFLTRLSAILQREASQGGNAGQSGAGSGGSGTTDAVIEQLAAAAALTSSSSGGSVSGSSSGMIGASNRPISASGRTPVASSRVKPNPAAAAVGGPAGAGPGNSEGVLANFFNSLLNKRSPVAGSVGATPPSAGQPATGSPGTGAQSTVDKLGMTPKDMQSELERLARSSKETLETNENTKPATPAPAQPPAQPQPEADNKVE